MSHKNKASLTKQVTDVLSAKLRIGQSKYEAKKIGNYRDGIYSYQTYHTYTKHCVAFVNWCKERHKCKTLSDCRLYVNEYLQSRSDLSAYTVKLDIAALAKLYGCTSSDFAATAPRLRANITRSRGDAVRDRHFSEANHIDLVTFCRSTGIRRHELEALRGGDWREENGVMYIHVRSGKGGKKRYVRVIGDADAIKARMLSVGEERVFPHVPTAADIHGYRREYAAAYYEMIARPVESLKPTERYVCRKDKKGIVYDRQAMLTVSQSLGHERIDVIAGHYID